MKRIPTVLAAVLSAVAVATTGCGGGSGDARTAPSAGRVEERPPADAAPADATPAAFAFSAPALGGGRVDGADYADTGLALWFWAPW